MLTPATIRVPSIMILNNYVSLLIILRIDDIHSTPLCRWGELRMICWHRRRLQTRFSRTLGPRIGTTDYQTVSVACEDTRKNQLCERKRCYLQNRP